MFLYAAFIAAQGADLLTRLSSVRTEANPVIAATGWDPVTAFLLKTVVICLVIAAASALSTKGRRTAAARLLGFGITVGVIGALSNI